MLFRPLLAVLLLVLLSGCFKANFVSVVDKKGNVVSQGEIALSLLFAENLDKIVQDLRSKGYEVSVDVRKDGMVAATWQQKGFPLEGKWSCGWFGGDCTYTYREKIDVSAQDQALMGAFRSDPDTAKMAPEVRITVVLPHNSKVKSSDAAKVVEDADGVNLLWSIDPYKTGVIKANFTAKLGDGQKSSAFIPEEKKAPSVSMALPDPPRQIAVPERRESPPSSLVTDGLRQAPSWKEQESATRSKGNPFRRLGFSISTEGEITVTHVEKGGAAFRSGLIAGDVIKKINGTATNMETADAIGREINGKTVTMMVSRGILEPKGIRISISDMIPTNEALDAVSKTKFSLPSGSNDLGLELYKTAYEEDFIGHMFFAFLKDDEVGDNNYKAICDCLPKAAFYRIRNKEKTHAYLRSIIDGSETDEDARHFAEDVVICRALHVKNGR